MEGFGDLANAFADDKEMERKDNAWKIIIDKYSNMGDGEEDGVNLNNFTEDEEENEEESYDGCPEAVEDNPSDVEESDQQLQLYTNGGSFAELSDVKKFEKLSCHFTAEALSSMIAGYQRRCAQLEKKNLTFWNVSPGDYPTQNMRMTESISEQFISGNSCYSRQTLRSAEVSRTNLALNHEQASPAFHRDRFHVNNSHLAQHNPGFNVMQQMNITNISPMQFHITFDNRSASVNILQSSTQNVTTNNNWEIVLRPSTIKQNQTQAILPAAKISELIKVEISSEDEVIVKNETVVIGSSDDEMPLISPPPCKKPDKKVPHDAKTSHSNNVPSEMSYKQSTFASEVKKKVLKEKTKPNDKSPLKASTKAASSKPNKQKVKEKAKIVENIHVAPQAKNEVDQVKFKAEPKEKNEKKSKNEKKPAETKIDDRKKLQEDLKRKSKRQCQEPSKVRVKAKKVRVRASITPQASSDEENYSDTFRQNTTIKNELPPPKSNIKPARTYSEVIQDSFQMLPELTLDDISCGSSCSTVTSDDDKYFSKGKFDVLRQKKKLDHRQQKLLTRTGMSSAFSDSKMEVTKIEIKTKEKKLAESSSPYSSDDDYCAGPSVKAKRAAKKVRWEAKLAARQRKEMPPPKCLPPKKVDQKLEKSQKQVPAGKENQPDRTKQRFWAVVDSESD